MRLFASFAGIALALSGCAKEPEPGGLAKHLCRSWKEISISKDDKLTKGTAADIAGTNAAHETWCPGPQVKVAAKK